MSVRAPGGDHLKCHATSRAGCALAATSVVPRPGGKGTPWFFSVDTQGNVATASSWRVSQERQSMTPVARVRPKWWKISAARFRG